MTVLSVVRAVSTAIGIDRPEAVFSSTEREHVELAELANEMAERIAEAFDWNILKRLQTYTGNGETDAYPLPTDYDRMPVAQSVYTSRFRAALQHVTSHDHWLDLTTRNYSFGTGGYTLLGGELVFLPVLAAGETARLYYMSNLWATDADGEPRTEFMADTDLFRLDEALLKLGMVWQWKAYKGLGYAEEMATYEQRLAHRVARDGGSRMIRIGTARMPRGVTLAYPGVIVP